MVRGEAESEKTQPKHFRAGTTVQKGKIMTESLKVINQLALMLCLSQSILCCYNRISDTEYEGFFPHNCDD